MASVFYLSIRKNRQANEWDKIESQEIDPKKYSQLNLVLEQNPMENSLQQMMLERLTSMQEKKNWMQTQILYTKMLNQNDHKPECKTENCKNRRR